MTKLVWRGQLGSYYYRPDNILFVDEHDIEEGYGPAVLAHELAHKRTGLILRKTDNPIQMYYKELYTWISAFRKGLSKEEADERLIDDSLGGYLEHVREAYGDNSEEYREAGKDYLNFKRKYLL